jgi:BirA family biotin operon repressor/biotin-[acetyl-CoA-carboxylase] ligase
VLDIQSFETLSSTQHYLVEGLKQGRLHAPLAVISKIQYAGVGSRNNQWIGQEGNLFCSIALPISSLPHDLPLASASIYFSYIMKRLLVAYNDRIWLKWPNDFYLGDQKVGGTITQKVGEALVCGMGVNLQKAPHGFAHLDGVVSAKELLNRYIEALEKSPSWKRIFSEFEIEFHLSRDFSTHHSSQNIALKDAKLCMDGSLLIDGKKVYSLR